jgi:Ala-tRNA(Pro) deacylase
LSIKQLYEKNIEILTKLKIPHNEYDHEPVLDYETARKIREKFKLTGVESKNLLLKSKKNEYFLLLTIEGKNADFDFLKQLTGQRLSLASAEELKKETGCIPGCATPFGNIKEIIIIFDKDILKHEKYIYSPGFPNKTIEIETKDIEKILNSMENRIISIYF